MSQWTHVSAVIRYDGIKGQTPDPSLGRTVHFDDPRENWHHCDVPRGSEGSLQYRLEEVGTGAVRFTAMIWGDLRDFSSVDGILEYLDRITAGQMIRSGLAEIEVEYQQTIVLRYDDDLDRRCWERIWTKEADEAAEAE